MSHCQIASRAFSKRTLSKLAKLGVYVVNGCYLPDEHGSFIGVNAESGFGLDDNGTYKIKRHREVLALVS